MNSPRENTGARRANSVSAVIRKQLDRDEAEEKYRPISMTLLWRLLGWLKPYRGMYTLGVLCGLLAIALEMVSPLMAQRIIDVGIPSGEADVVVRFALCWAGILVVAYLFEAIQLGITHRCGEKVIYDLRVAVFDHLQKLSMSFYDRTKLGRIITRGSSDINAVQSVAITGLTVICVNSLMMAGSGLMILLTDWRLFLALAWLVPVISFTNRIYRHRIGGAWQVVRSHMSRLTSNLAENITGVRVVEAFNRQDENLSRFNALQNINTQNNLRAANINGVYQPLLETLRFAGQAVVLAYGGYMVMSGSLTAGKVIQVFFYWDFFMRPTITIGNFYNTLMMAMASSERVFGLLDLEPSIQDRPQAKALPPLKGEIVFEGVTFGYDPARPVLRNIDLRIPAGKTYALVGQTGSGKSSTLSLMARFYEFQEGRILLDGIDIREATGRSLHKQMGLVLQVNYLFTGTILDNIRYPRPEARDEDVYAAAKALGIHETFAELPKGYLTDVGERGANVSLGLRQLICFARVFLANPRIFLLDEATSSIDTVTETKIQAALERLVRDRTTVIVAHRLSTITKADCIVVLDHGRLAEQGTHDELVALDGIYAGMYERFVSHQSESPIISLVQQTTENHPKHMNIDRI